MRRALFEALHVPTGYAVELAALVDIAARRGLDAIAQVDLGTRAHRHQALRDLGAMATQILAAGSALAARARAGGTRSCSAVPAARRPDPRPRGRRAATGGAA